MPGHVKKSTGPDEDPAPFLIISLEMKREDAMKPYDAKKSYWVPDPKGGFMEGMLESDDGTKAVVMCGHEVIILQSKISVFILLKNTKTELTPDENKT